MSALEEESSHEGDEEEEEESSSEDEEPKLKYQRIGATLGSILQLDMATCLYVHSKFLVLGTIKGIVHILDFHGNETKRLDGHQEPVREISVDKQGEFIASCSDDGKVVISSLYRDKALVQHHFSRPISCVALDPDYSKNKKERFVCGGKAGKLVMSEKGWFGSNLTVIHEGEGSIHALAWGSGLIAWANDIGVKVYDCNTKERITYIERPRGSPRPEQYRCCLFWEDATTLLIGWADSVKIAKVREREQPKEGQPTRFVEIIAMFQIDAFICGIAPFKEDLIILAFIEDDQYQINGGATKGQSKPPQLRIVTRNNEETSTEALNVSGFEHYNALNYRLDHLCHESLYYIVSPKDVVAAKPRDLDDHISWLMQRQRYEEALYAAEGHEKQLERHDIDQIGAKYLEHLLAEGEAEKAAGLCPKILKNDAKNWENWIYHFAKAHQLKAIGPKIPTQNPKLTPVIYEMVLGYYLNNDSQGFLNLVEQWPSDIYTITSVIAAVGEKVKTSTNATVTENLMIAQAKLFLYSKQYEKTLAIYLQLGKGNVFELVSQYELFDSIGDKVLELMRFDSQKATDLLINNIQRIPVTRVVQQLKNEPQLQLVYLHNLFYSYKDRKEINQAGKEFHNLQVKLYAHYNREPLYDFLEKSNFWHLEEALQVCQSKQLWKEMVFIYGRMGNIEEALNLMVDKVGDVKQAIEFVQKQNEENLWDDLIEKSIRNPVFVSGLLENVGTHINPLKLIEKIPKGMEIIGLRDRLVKIINDYLLQTSLSQGCKEVLKADVITLSQRLYKNNRRAIRIDGDARCAVSGAPVINSNVNNQQKKNVVVFFCNHVFYEDELLKTIGAPTSVTTSQKPTDKSVARRQSTLYCPICRQNAQPSRSERQRGSRR